MKIWEKIAELDRAYVEARKSLLLKQCDSVEIIVHREPKKKNVTKPSTKTSSQ